MSKRTGQRGSAAGAAPLASSRYALVIPPDIKYNEKPSSQEQLFAYQLSLADGKWQNYSLWKDSTSGRPTYLIYPMGQKPMGADDILMSDAKEFHPLYNKAESCDFFSPDPEKQNKNREEWYKFGIPRPATPQK